MKKNLVYLFNAVLGALTFVILALPFIASFVDVVGNKISETVSGYKIMDLWDYEALGVLSSLLQIFVLVIGILMLAYGVCGLLKEYGVFKAFPDSFGKLDAKKLGEYILLVYAAVNVLLLVFLIAFCIANTEEIYSAKAGFRVSGGMIVAPILSVGSYVAYKILNKKLLA